MMSTTSAVRPKDSVESKRGVLLLFAALMLSMLLAALSQTVLSTALPTIVGELDGVDLMLWVMTAYILASTVMMPVYGKLGDLIGRKSLLLMAISLFMTGSVVGGLAGDMSWLIVGRAIQGLGGGGLIILSQAIIADVVPARQRGKYMGFMGGVFAFSSVAGPLLGGWFTEGPGWRWTFWINLPLGAVAMLGAVLLLHIPRGSASGRPRMDVAGTGLLAIATTCVVLVGTWGGARYAWGSPVILGLIAGAVVTGVLFVLAERRAAEPVFPLHLFRERNFNLSTTAGLLIGVAMFGTISYMPTYLQMATGMSATVAGLLMTPMMAALLCTSVGVGFLVSRTGRYKWWPVIGASLIAVALALLSTMSVSTPVWLICVFLALLGMGLGTSMQLLVLIVQNTFPAREVGTATAANNYFRQIGASLGAAVVGSVFTQRLGDLIGQRLPSGSATDVEANSLTPELVNSLPNTLRGPIVESYNDALAPVYLYIAPLAILAMILLSFMKEKPLATRIERNIEPECLAEDELTISHDEDERPTDAQTAGTRR